MEGFEILRKKSLIVVFAYAPAGFGHLRVTDALYHGLPKDVTPVLLGSQDKSITVIHRLMSMHPFVRLLAFWAEDGWGEDVFTYFYRVFLRTHTKLLYQQITTLLDERIDVPKVVLVVATHFGLAHQLGAIKQKLIKERNIKVLLVVQVTDDNPHHIWYVEDADKIFVPSEKTKHGLSIYGKETHLKRVPIEVLAYPITPVLGKKLTETQFEERVSQVTMTSNSTIHIAVPISGAAVGTQFITKVIDSLYKKSSRFRFHVIVKTTAYTKKFVANLLGRSYVVIHAASHDREVVDLHERAYLENIISLEITKPSEQAFKALYDCTQIGASLLLFSWPVGRQEDNNLDFLRRHNLIPKKNEQLVLLKKAEKDQVLSQQETQLETDASLWRGICLPKDAKKSADFIFWCLKQGVFARMIHYKRSQKNGFHAYELRPDGVEQFWRNVSLLLLSQESS